MKARSVAEADAIGGAVEAIETGFVRAADLGQRMEDTARDRGQGPGVGGRQQLHQTPMICR